MGFASVIVKEWDEIQNLARRGWLYRGQRSASWPIQTSLERYCDRQGVSGPERPRIEAELFREFRRTYHHYADHVPDPSSVLEWMSLMQHHGAPTRLLDFTYSIFVACYFALEAADGDAAVWACDGP